MMGACCSKHQVGCEVVVPIELKSSRILDVITPVEIELYRLSSSRDPSVRSNQSFVKLQSSILENLKIHTIP
jgi:hypothetical protein